MEHAKWVYRNVDVPYLQLACKLFITDILLSVLNCRKQSKVNFMAAVGIFPILFTT